MGLPGGVKLFIDMQSGLQGPTVFAVQHESGLWSHGLPKCCRGLDGIWTTKWAIVRTGLWQTLDLGSLSRPNWKFIKAWVDRATKGSDSSERQFPNEDKIGAIGRLQETVVKKWTSEIRLKTSNAETGIGLGELNQGRVGPSFHGLEPGLRSSTQTP
jgi:hypothetical protein